MYTLRKVAESMRQERAEYKLYSTTGVLGRSQIEPARKRGELDGALTREKTFIQYF